ncbi:hypothetical protein [Isobaculum melis]|uniref:Uncharacterized protein n=1 Tax=Isobaculum melis TaxID=142588 RepID=A0A1H9PTM2_9LACT|nr:hypothetical protein [Isobaculum melis]SER51567.1 hypothetical protein SAMN04488559_101130 [Isobaculum melis]
MAENYTEADIFLVIYDTLDTKQHSLFCIIKNDKAYHTKLITKQLQEMKAIKIHEMNFWYEGHIRNKPIYLEEYVPYQGAVALQVEGSEDLLQIEEVLLFDVTFSNEHDFVFRRKIIFPKNIKLQLIEEEIREMYWQVKEIQTISLAV